MMENGRKAIIVGASSGIGASLGRELARRGWRVALLARREKELGDLCNQINAGTAAGRASAHPHDAADFDKVPALFDALVQEMGGLDLIIYNAGVMMDVGEREYNFEKDRAIVTVNTLGAMAWLNKAAAHFEARGSGTIAGISSVAGDRGRKGNPAYCASKAALNTYLAALGHRLMRQGINVVTIKPGFVATRMTEGKQGLFWLIGPDEAAGRILSAIEAGRPVAYVPWQWRWLMLVVRAIPTFIFKRLNF